ncbi:MAG: hypothetical protein FJZ60_00050 [Chlamydiae bacterium]|nr:hypothetical protein [Chlamydiota bacterium]
MAIERKQLAEKVEKKKVDKVDVKKVKRSFKPDNLSNAIVEGKFVALVGSEIIVNRFRNGKESFHVCTVKQIDENGLIHTWDETIHQWFVFSVKDSPKVVKLSG